MQHLSGDLGVELPERAYGTDCTIYDSTAGIKWDNLRETVFDEFVLAHILGWWGKALMLRSHFLLWILSIGFELMELTFQVSFRPEKAQSVVPDIALGSTFAPEKLCGLY